MKSYMIIYHGPNCFDGIAALWATQRGLVMNGADPNDIEYVCAAYNDPPPDVTGRDVYIVDFSYKRTDLIAMAKVAKSIVILDHHEENIKALVDLPPIVHIEFNLEKSGTEIAFDFFNIDRSPTPMFIKNITDNDLGLQELPNTKAFVIGLASRNLFSASIDEVFMIFDGCMRDTDHEAGWYQVLIQKGRPIADSRDADIAATIKICMRIIPFDGYMVPICPSVPSHYHDTAMAMMKDYPFAVTYYDTKTARKFSLRSPKGGVDVRTICRQFGGGGHKHASGFTISLDNPLHESLIKCYEGPVRKPISE